MKPHILLLHGALGSRDQFNELEQLLNIDFYVHKINFRGHGGRTLPDAFLLEEFIEDILFYLKAEKIHKTYIFGFSMGGFVGLHFTKLYTERVLGMVTLGTKWQWTPEIANHEIKNLDPVKIIEKVPNYAKYLAQLHRPNSWEEVLYRTGKFMQYLGNHSLSLPFNQINQPIYILRGEKDEMITEIESKQIADALPNGHFMELHQQIHPLEKVDPQLIAETITMLLLD
jgi:pimeloyl-ACP methyl ester carboxylesterase